jgi:hypothetical protein
LRIGEALIPALVTGKAPDGVAIHDARFEQYRYRWAQQGGCAVALFQPRKLPRNDDVVIPAMRHVIQTALGADVRRAESKLLLRGEVNTIAFQAEESGFEVATIKEDTGEPHTIVVWRVAR